jgi:Mce-associated membrane protein
MPPEPSDNREPAAAEPAEPAAAETTEQAEPAAEEATEQAEPAAAETTEPAPTEPAAAETPAGAGWRGWRVPALLGLVTVLLGGFGVWAAVAAGNLRHSGGQNVALTDAAATSAVRHQVSSAVNTIFSYRYNDTAATRRAAQSLLTGPAIRQYDRLFGLVEKEAPAQQLVVTTRVTNSGVEFLAGGRARVLVFADQQDTRAGTSQASYGGTMFAVTAVRDGTRWKIENIDTFTG